jgi:hypothetical protein
MNPDLLLKITQSILIDPVVKDQIINQRDSLTSEQQQTIEECVSMWSDIEWDLYQTALDHNPTLQQWLKQIIQKHQTKSFSSLGWDSKEADQLLNDLLH